MTVDQTPLASGSMSLLPDGLRKLPDSGRPDNPDDNARPENALPLAFETAPTSWPRVFPGL